jgi:hypothetical protein
MRNLIKDFIAVDGEFVEGVHLRFFDTPTYDPPNYNKRENPATLYVIADTKWKFDYVILQMHSRLRAIFQEVCYLILICIEFTSLNSTIQKF